MSRSNYIACLLAVSVALWGCEKKETPKLYQPPQEPVADAPETAQAIAETSPDSVVEPAAEPAAKDSATPETHKAAASEAAETPPPEKSAAIKPVLREKSLGTIRVSFLYQNYHLLGSIREDEIKFLKDAGVATVINLIPQSELEYNEAKAVKGLGMEYHHVPLNETGVMSNESWFKLRELLKHGAEKKVALHSGSGNRVAAVWLVKRVLDDAVAYDEALAEARTIGLRSNEMTEKMRLYIEKQLQDRVTPPALAAAAKDQTPEKQPAPPTVAKAQPAPVPVEPPKPQQPEIVAEELEGVSNLHAVGGFYLSGQPTREALAAFKEKGVKVVINLRAPAEPPFNEEKAVRDLGLEYHQITLGAPNEVTDETFDAVRELLEKEKEGTVLVHCGVGVRVAAAWLAKRTLDDGLPFDEALAEARIVGKIPKPLVDRTQAYIERRHVAAPPNVAAASTPMPQPVQPLEPGDPPGPSVSATTQAVVPAGELKEVTLGKVNNLHVFNGYYLAGQPAEEDFALLKERGVKTVINLRTAVEISFDEEKLVRDQGMAYHGVPFGSAESLTDEKIETLRALLKAEKDGPVLLHCAGAVRVGAVWLVKRVLDDGLEYDKALAEAKAVGLRSQPLIDRAKEYIEQHKK